MPNMFASLGFMEMMLDERDNDVSLEVYNQEKFGERKLFIKLIGQREFSNNFFSLATFLKCSNQDSFLLPLILKEH